MKKTYLKPDVEYVSLIPEEINTAVIKPEAGTSELPDDFEW